MDPDSRFPNLFYFHLSSCEKENKNEGKKREKTDVSNKIKTKNISSGNALSTTSISTSFSTFFSPPLSPFYFPKDQLSSATPQGVSFFTPKNKIFSENNISPNISNFSSKKFSSDFVEQNLTENLIENLIENSAEKTKKNLIGKDRKIVVKNNFLDYFYKFNSKRFFLFWNR